MDENQLLAARFEANRNQLQAVAYRMLGSLAEAEDALQETWLRVGSSSTNEVENLAGWLRMVLARVCLDMLRKRKSGREVSWEAQALERVPAGESGIDPEQEALLAESVGMAMLVVLQRLAPAERLAFVLHDMFAVPFEEIARIAGRSTAAARQLASRARRRVRGEAAAPEADLMRQREVVEAFLAASRGGDFDALLALLDPDVTVRADRDAAPPGVATELRGATVVAKQVLLSSTRARFSWPALVDGTVGIVMAPRGRLFLVLRFTLVRDKIAHIDVIAEHDRLRRLELAVLPSAT